MFRLLTARRKIIVKPDYSDCSMSYWVYAEMCNHYTSLVYAIWSVVSEKHNAHHVDVYFACFVILSKYDSWHKNTYRCLVGNSLVHAFVSGQWTTLWRSLIGNELSARPPRGRYSQWTEVKIQIGRLQIVWRFLRTKSLQSLQQYDIMWPPWGLREILIIFSL